ncbi:MAG: hypothetical protein R2742_11975 [Micropruina glycogenica]
MVLGVLVAIPAAFATWLRVLPPSSDELAKVASFIPYGLVMWVPAMVLLGTATIRSWRLPQARTSGARCEPARRGRADRRCGLGGAGLHT